MSEWLANEYIQIFKKELGVERISKDEQDFFDDFFTFRIDSYSKIIYYNAVFRFQKGYPQFIIFWFIKREFKAAFKELGASDSFVQVIDKFANKTLFSAKKACCKFIINRNYQEEYFIAPIYRPNSVIKKLSNWVNSIWFKSK